MNAGLSLPTGRMGRGKVASTGGRREAAASRQRSWQPEYDKRTVYLSTTLFQLQMDKFRLDKTGENLEEKVGEMREKVNFWESVKKLKLLQNELTKPKPNEQQSRRVEEFVGSQLKNFSDRLTTALKQCSVDNFLTTVEQMLLCERNTQTGMEAAEILIQKLAEFEQEITEKLAVLEKKITTLKEKAAEANSASRIDTQATSILKKTVTTRDIGVNTDLMETEANSASSRILPNVEVHSSSPFAINCGNVTFNVFNRPDSHANESVAGPSPPQAAVIPENVAATQDIGVNRDSMEREEVFAPNTEEFPSSSSSAIHSASNDLAHQLAAPPIDAVAESPPQSRAPTPSNSDSSGILSGQSRSSSSSSPSSFPIRRYPIRHGFGCSQCPKRYTNKHNVKRHEFLKHSEIKPTFRCFICKKYYSSSGYLTYHLRWVH